MGAATLCGVAVWFLVARQPGAPGGVTLSVLGAAVAAGAGLAVAECLAREPRTYFVALALHAVVCAVAVLIAGAHTAVTLCLGLVITLGICLHDPFPLNALFSASVNGLLMVTTALVLRHRASSSEVALALVGYGLAAAMLTLLGVLALRYRERLVAAQGEIQRLDGLVDRLTRANLNYQEYARTVEEASADSERKRITRDIHDVVGYTLTNTITMMEAIIDIMRTNPLGVASLVDAARENAEEGLARVREALHTLRRAEVSFPTGLSAVHRLIHVFEQATGVKVEFAFTEVAWSFPAEIDSALYHVIQEGLMNSFRHGKATVVRIFLRRDGDRIELSLKDNGVGATGLVEGIGLAGMKERLARFGGDLRARTVPGGFEVRAMVPGRLGATA